MGSLRDFAHQLQERLPRFLPLLISAGSLGAPLAQATELIAPGIQTKASGNAGQTVSRSAGALFFNPANLIFSKPLEPYLDISYVKVTYTYKHADAELYPDPVVVNATGTPITVGASARLIPRLALGVAFVPTGAGQVRRAAKVPLFVPGVDQYPEPESEPDVATVENGFKFAGGAAYRLLDTTILGLGLIYISDTKIQQQVTAPEDTDPFLDIANSGSAMQVILGGRTEVMARRLAIGASVKLPTTKKYKGDYYLSDPGDGPSDPIPTTTAVYLPLTLGLGAEVKKGNFGGFIDLVLEQWSAGRSITKRGLESDPPTTDLKDTINFNIGGKIWVAGSNMLTASFGMHGSNIGNGTAYPTEDAEAEEDAPRVAGMSYGNLEGIPRTILAGGYRRRFSSKGYAEMAFQYQSGTRNVPIGFSQEGTHSLSAILLGAGVTYGF